MFKELEIGWGVFFRQVVAPTAGPAILTFIPLALAFWLLGADSILLLGVAALCCLAYAGVFWRGSLAPAERVELLEHAPKPLRGWAVTR